MAKKKNHKPNGGNPTKKNPPKKVKGGTMKEAVDKAINGEVHTGKVKFNDIRKGYGFITDDKTGEEVFFHYTGIKSGRNYKGFLNNDTVSFVVRPGEKGLEARSIVLETPENESIEESAEEVEEKSEE